MDWSDERYVRVYTRDTVTWENLEWDGQTVFLHLLRKVDRAGVLEFSQEDGAEAAVKAVTRLPLDVIEPGLAKCLKRGVIEAKGSALVIPKFIEAQEAHQSDRQRMKEYRARRRDLARHASVTERNASQGSPDAGAKAPSVTERNADESPRNDSDTPRRQIVTPSRTTPSLTVPNRSDPTAAAPRERGNGHVPEQQPEQPKTPETKSEKTPCPVDLWEHMPTQTKKALDVAMIPAAAQEYLCRGFAARYAGRPDQTRTLDQWVSSAVRAIQADWNDPNKRPKPATAPAGSGVPPAARPPQDFSDPLSQRLLNRKIQ